jgi:hypothetical protein
VSAGEPLGAVVWEAATGAIQQLIRSDEIDDAAWLGADRVLLKETFKAGRIEWNPQSGATTPTLAGFDFDAMSVSDDARRVATVKPSYVVIRSLP